MTYSIAMLSAHTSPLDMPGRTREAGGMNVYIRQLARELGQSRLHIDIFTRLTNESSPLITQLSPQVRVIAVPAGPPLPIHKDELYAYMPAFAQQVEDFRRREALHYDLLHSHYWLSGAAGMRLAQRWRVPHVIMFHTLAHLKQLANPDAPETPRRLETERRLIAYADRIIATTPGERAQMIRHCGAAPRAVQVIPCGVDLRCFVPRDRAEARQQLGWNPDVPILLFAGRLGPFKGPDLLLRAAAMMQTRAEVVIVGGQAGDPEILRLRELADELKLHRRTHFPGAQTQQQLALMYCAADVTVVPSFHESFGLVAVESLACGTPVVATRAGGLTTIVRHGETGYLVPRCPGFFAEKLDMLLQQPDLLNRMRLAARPSVQSYNWIEVARQVRALYEDVLEESCCLAAL
jgi:D-inositol-3-phosphate glycosyltransferase